MEAWKLELLRRIPKVDGALAWPEVREALAGHPRWAVLETVREVLARRRAAIAALSEPGPDRGGGTEALRSLFLELLPARAAMHLRPLINAAGIVVHTNLGRSVLPLAVQEQVARIAGSYSNLEYDLAAGQRGSRQDHCAELLVRLTGAEAGLVVNNNAAAVFLCLNTLAEGREVVVSRGQLVEIGGSFRIPDVMRKSGALLREVGTTNKTRLTDYRDAIGAQTALLLKVHTSNFRVVGFTASVGLEELAALGREAGVPVMEDLGSGSLVDLSPFGLPDEPTVRAAVAAGADLVTFSGDKLLGGPQSGLIVGRADLIARVRANPLHRAMRIDKMTLAALEATLRLYLDGEHGWRRIPTLAMIAATPEQVRARARRALRRIGPECRRDLRAAVVATVSQVGGGALPLEPVRSAALSLGTEALPAHRLEAALRARAVPVIGRIQEGRLLLDMRTVADGEVPELARAVREAAEALRRG